MGTRGEEIRITIQVWKHAEKRRPSNSILNFEKGEDTNPGKD